MRSTWSGSPEKLSPLSIDRSVLVSASGGHAPRASGRQAIGTDISLKMLHHAREKYPDVPFYQMNMDQLGFDNKKFAGVFINASFQHLTPLKAADSLDELKRVIDLSISKIELARETEIPADE